MELGVNGTEGVEGLEESCGAGTYSFFMICIRLIEGDSISTIGFRFFGVTGIGELLAITPNGSGLESGGASALMMSSLELGVLVGLGMRCGGGGAGA